MVFNIFGKNFLILPDNFVEYFKLISTEDKIKEVNNIIKKKEYSLFKTPRTLLEFKQLKNNINFLIACYEYGINIIDKLNPSKEIDYIYKNVSKEYKPQIESLFSKLFKEQQLFYKNNPDFAPKNWFYSLFTYEPSGIVTKKDYLDYLSENNQDKIKLMSEKLELPEIILTDFINTTNPIIITRILELNCKYSKNLLRKQIVSDLNKRVPKGFNLKNDLKKVVDEAIENYFNNK